MNDTMPTPTTGVIMNEFRKKTYLPKNERKNILLLSDDLRMPSGVGVMSKEFVLGTAQHFNWYQLGAAIKHPEEGKIYDLSEQISNDYGIPDPNVLVRPNNGYGNPDIIREIIATNKIDAILHFTDPRQWIWLYQMEHEIRQTIPILFYSIWDNVPYPMYNKYYYESCDWIGAISKQTKNIIENVWDKKEEWRVQYLPHGINSEYYRPIKENDVEYPKLLEFKKQIFGEKDPEFVVLFNSRNIRRKHPGQIILAFKQLRNMLPDDKKDKISLVMHTQPIDQHGTDLIAVAKDLASECDIIFSSQKLNVESLVYLYNIADVTINLSNAEGFGLSTAESLMCGTPIIATVTGGLQDQMRFVDENGNWINFTTDFPSNHNGRYKQHGEWAFPVFPATQSLVGSPPTPYIYDDNIRTEDAVKALKDVYDLGREERNRIGLLGREWLISEESGMSAESMSAGFIKGIHNAIDGFKPRDRFKLYKI